MLYLTILFFTIYNCNTYFDFAELLPATNPVVQHNCKLKPPDGLFTSNTSPTKYKFEKSSDCIVFGSISWSGIPPLVTIAFSVPSNPSILTGTFFSKFISTTLSSRVILLHCLSGSIPDNSTIIGTIELGKILSRQFLNFFLSLFLKISWSNVFIFEKSSDG